MEGMYDIHCHAVPGVDDGAPTIKEALGILKAEYSDGVRGIILTPHFRLGMFETSREKVRESFDTLKKLSGEQNPDLKLYLGCEFHVCSEITEYFKRDEDYCMAGTNHVLIEFSGRDSLNKIVDYVYRVRSQGYIPIIAHVERYQAVRENRDIVQRLTRMGAKLQVNADSITGRDGWSVKRFCRRLIEDGLLEFVGSDAHDTRERAPRIGECIKQVEKKYGRSLAEQLFIKNPASILSERQ